MSQTTTDLEQPTALVDTAASATASAEVEFSTADGGGKVDDDDDNDGCLPSSTGEDIGASAAAAAAAPQQTTTTTAPPSGRSHHNIHQQANNAAGFSSEGILGSSGGAVVLPPIAAAAAITLPPSALNNVLINSNAAAMIPQSILTSPVMSASAAASVMRGTPSSASSAAGGNVRRGPIVSSVMGKQATSSAVLPNHRSYGGPRNSGDAQQLQQVIMGSTNPALGNFSTTTTPSNNPYSPNFVTYGGSPTGPSPTILPPGATPSVIGSGGGGSTRPLSAQRYNSVHGTYSTSPSYGEPQVLSERVVEHEVRVPRKVIREDIVERVIVVPEKVVHEEVIEDLTTVRQRVVEVAKPIYQERIVEVPEIEIVQRIVEVPEVIVSEKIREVPRFEFQERIIEVPRIIQQERIVEVPEIEYHEIPVERVVEVPEVYEQVVLKQVPVPQYIEKPVPEYVNVEVEEAVFRKIPLPVETTTTVELKVPQIRTRYTRQDIPLYVPRFIEIAMPAELMDPAAIAEAEHYAQQVTLLANQSAASLCEVERLAGALKELDGHYAAMSAQGGDNQCVSSMISNWKDGKFHIAGEFQHESNNEEEEDDDQSAGAGADDDNRNVNENNKDENRPDVNSGKLPDVVDQQPEGDDLNLEKHAVASDPSNPGNVANREEGGDGEEIATLGKGGDSACMADESELAQQPDSAQDTEPRFDEQMKPAEVETAPKPVEEEKVNHPESSLEPLHTQPIVAP